MDYSEFSNNYNVIPNTLTKIITHDTQICPKCNNELHKEIKIVKKSIHDGDWCPGCNIRPFSYTPCNYIYIDENMLFITCNTCLYTNCSDCGDKIIYNKKLCEWCEEICDVHYNKNDKPDWKNLSIKECLMYYGLPRIRKIAHMKGIKDYMVGGKGKLIKILLPLITKNDLFINLTDVDKQLKKYVSISEICKNYDIVKLRKLADKNGIKNYMISENDLLNKLISININKCELDINVGLDDLKKYLTNQEQIDIARKYLKEQNIKCLKAYATHYAIPGRSKMSKDELVASITANHTFDIILCKFLPNFTKK